MDPADVGKMTEEELCPEASKAVREGISLQRQQKIKVIESSIFKCRHCGGRKVTYRQCQTRSADEPPDIVVDCTMCGRTSVYRQ